MEGKKVTVHQQHQPTIKRLQVNPKGDERMRCSSLYMNDICKTALETEDLGVPVCKPT